MIARLEGKIKEIDTNWLILDVAQVGYKVFVLDETLGKDKGEKLTLYTHLYIRENLQELYGFATLEELKVFEALISVSGVGPKGAIKILSRSSIEKIRSAIEKEDPAQFTAVSGIGKKMASKIIIELKSKLLGSELSSIPITKSSEEVFIALEKLGYSQLEIREVLAKLPSELKGSQEKVSWALKNISK